MVGEVAEIASADPSKDLRKPNTPANKPKALSGRAQCMSSHSTPQADKMLQLGFEDQLDAIAKDRTLGFRV